MQLPKQLPYCQTVHKLQGATLQLAIIDLSSLNWQSRLSYVAISRVQYPANLLTLPFRNPIPSQNTKCYVNGISSSLKGGLAKNSLL